MLICIQIYNVEGKEICAPFDCAIVPNETEMDEELAEMKANV